MKPATTKPCLLRAAAAVLILPLLVAMLFLAVRLVINAPDFFAAEYEKIGNAADMGMSNADLTAATVRMIDYMEAREDSIDIRVSVNGDTVSMFNERERLHMIDVRALYQGFITALTIAVPLALALLVLLYFLSRRRGDTLRFFPQSFLRGSALFLLLLGAVMAWVLIDFDSFWTAFHLLFFTNDLWLLDPATSRMINMMPLQLFFDIVTRVALLFAAAWAVLLALCAWLLRKKPKEARQ